MPGRKDDPQYPVTTTPDVNTGAGDPAVPVTAVDGKTTDVTSAEGKQLFGDGPQPPNLPPRADGLSGNPVSRTQDAQNAADDTISGTAGGPGLPRSNAVAAAQANDATLTEFDADTVTGAEVARIPGTLTRTRIAQARAPHYFSEQTDNVFIPDFLIYICGANVTPHVKGTLQWSFGLDNTPNTCSFTLDNSNDKFTITPENVIYNHFHAGQSSNPNGEFDDSAKAKIWLYKNNQLPLPVGKGFFKPNTAQEHDAGGRRLPLNVYGSIFHKMDPIRVWIRVSPFDEWLPAFAGYVVRHGHTEGWVGMEREVHIQASCVREQMRKMRVQHNSVMYNLLGATTLTEAYDPSADVSGHGFSTPDDPTGTIHIDNSFFNSILRGASKYQFAWSGMSFREISEYMTIGGLAKSIVNVKSSDAADAPYQAKIKRLDTELQDATARRESFNNEVIGYQGLLSQPNLTPTEQTDLTKKLEEAQGFLASNDKMVIELSAALQKERDNPPTKVGSVDHVHGIGRMGLGERVYYPDESAKSTDVASQKKNADRLDRWYRICMFGSPIRRAKIPDRSGDTSHMRTGMDEKPDMSSQNVRYWTLDEIANPKTGAGSRCRWDDLWAPDNQLVHWLLPPPSASGADSTNITDNTLNFQGAGVRTWITRNDMIQEFATMVDYRWWVTGVGDIVFEFPMYDFEPQDLGPWEDVLTLDLHALNSNLDEEAGEVFTALRAVGTITGQGNLNGASANISEFTTEGTPNDIVMSPNLISRLGINVKVANFPFIKDGKLLTKLAMAAFQKSVLEAEQSGLELGFRPWLTPNRPIKFVPRDRISLTGTVTHAMTVFGACTTSVETGFTRQLDTTGLRRYMTGGAHQPLSFGIIGGPGNLRSSLDQRVDRTNRSLALMSKVVDPRDKKDLLDANVVGDTHNAKDRFPSGYDVYNVVDFDGFDNNGVIPPDAGQQARIDAQDAAKSAFTSKQSTAAAGVAGIANDLPGGGTTGSSGIVSLNNPPKAASKDPGTAPTRDISIGTGSTSDSLMATDSSDAQQLKQGPGAGIFSSADIYNLGAIIASQSRGRNATQAEKTAIGWTVLNAAGANSSTQNLKPSSISGEAARYQPHWVDPASIDLARSILSGQTADPTGGATSFANYDPNVPYEDPRVCSAITGQIVKVNPGATRTVEGQDISDIGHFVFFKRIAAREAAVEASNQAAIMKMPAPFDKIEQFTKDAAARFKIQEAVICGYIMHECGGYYNSDRLKPNGTGDIGAGTNWVLFESSLFDFASNELKGMNALVREHNRFLGESLVLSTGATWSLKYLWHRVNEGQLESVFVRIRVVDASKTEFKGAVVGGVLLATFWSGKAADVEAAAKTGNLDNVLKPYDLSKDPLTAIVASPRVNVFLSAKAIRIWLDRFKGNGILTAVHGKYTDMDLGGYTVDNYYKAAYSMGNAGQVATLLALGSHANIELVDFRGVPVSTTAKNITVPGGTYVPVRGGMAMHGNAIGGQPLGEFILEQAYTRFWPVVKSRTSTSLLDQCQQRDPHAISELEKRFQNGQTLDETLNTLYKKNGT